MARFFPNTLPDFSPALAPLNAERGLQSLRHWLAPYLGGPQHHIKPSVYTGEPLAPAVSLASLPCCQPAHRCRADHATRVLQFVSRQQHPPMAAAAAATAPLPADPVPIPTAPAGAAGCAYALWHAHRHSAALAGAVTEAELLGGAERYARAALDGVAGQPPERYGWALLAGHAGVYCTGALVLSASAALAQRQGRTDAAAALQGEAADAVQRFCAVQRLACSAACEEDEVGAGGEGWAAAGAGVVQ